MGMIADPKEIGAKIRDARMRAGLTQLELAARVGTSQQTIEKIELGKVKRSSYLLPIYEVLGLRLLPRKLTQPPVEPGKTDLRGKALRERREFLGMERSEFAAFSGLSLEQVVSAETASRWSDAVKEALEMNLALERLESGEPLGEPYAPLGYTLSALPSITAKVPLFTMQQEKGIKFQGYIPGPDVVRNLAFMFCVQAGSWARGFVSPGDRIYCRLDPDPWKWRPGTMVAASKTGQHPDQMEEMLFGILVGWKRDECLIKLENEPQESLSLSTSQWNIYLVVMATWTEETMSKLLAPR